jgi:hypothetical protein
MVGDEAESIEGSRRGGRNPDQVSKGIDGCEREPREEAERRPGS